MKIVLVFTALVAIAVAAPRPLESHNRPTPIPIIQLDEQHDDFGQFSIFLKTGNGIILTRQGALKPTPDGKGHVLIQSGSESYTAPEGKLIRLTWTADEDGYHPVGDHLPVPPSVPSPAGPESSLAA